MYHPQVSRRVAIQAGSVGLLGLGMNHLEPLQAMASESPALPTAKNVIYILHVTSMYLYTEHRSTRFGFRV